MVFANRFAYVLVFVVVVVLLLFLPSLQGNVSIPTVTATLILDGRARALVGGLHISHWSVHLCVGCAVSYCKVYSFSYYWRVYNEIHEFRREIRMM